MIKEKNISLIIKLAQKPDIGTPLDFEIIAKLLMEYPDFDLLRKVFIKQGLKFGAKGANFEAELELWNLKKKIFSKPIVLSDSESSIVNTYTIEERIGFFLRGFKAINTPF